jgi:DNA-binding MarR family transcriptional regulator
MSSDLARLMRRTFKQRMAELEISFEQMRVLVLVSRNEGIRQVELADLLEIQPITLVHQLDQLTRSDLVERRPDPNDRRAYQLFLTDAAEPHLTAIRKIAREVDQEMMAGMSQNQIVQARDALRTMRENLSNRKTA